MVIVRQTNFATGKPRPVARIATIVWTAVFLCLALTWWVIADLAAVEKQIALFQEHQEKLANDVAAQNDKAEGVPSDQDYAALQSRVEYYNSLSGQRSAPVLEVLKVLGTIIPKDVRLSKFVFDEESGRLVIALQTENDAELPQLLERLEREASFSSVILQRQVRLQQEGKQLLQFEIEAIAS